MPETKFDIRKKIKYGEEWDWDETRTWMEETQKLCFEDFAKVSEDYKRYKKSDFAALEESIAINIFGITKDFSKRAYKGMSLLRYFAKDQRALATQARKKMEEISESKDVIDMQIVPIAARMDEDLKRDKEETDKDRLIKEKNKNTGRIFVFRIKDANGNPVFLDCQLRIYKKWEDYLTGNKSPQCIMCYPKDGFLRKEMFTAVGSRYYVANDVQFCEPPSCTLINRAKSTLDTVIVYATPVIAIGSFYCPATWAWTAYALSCASTGLFLYGLTAQGIQLYDQIGHGEDYGASLMTFITSIATMIVNKGLNKYLRGVAAEARALTTMESVVITGFLLGLSGSQVASFAWMTWSLACKPKLEPMDIVSYAVACHNLYSCMVSPWTANKLLKKVQNEIQAEHLKGVEKNTKERTKETDKVAENEKKLADLRRAGGDPAAIAQTEREIEAGWTRIQELERKILEHQNDFLDNTGKWMKDAGAREKYTEFREGAMPDREEPRDREIDQNNRIIKVVTYMDAEMVFKMVSLSQSKIRFANGQTMDLLVNSQLEVHPRALDQMNRISEKTGKNDLKNMMELTKAYTDSTADGYQGDRQEAMKTYMKDIKNCLGDYQMITRLEIQKVKETIKSHTTDEGLRRRLAEMTPAEAYRMRTVIGDAPERTLDLANRMAAAHGNNNIDISTYTLAAWVEIAKLELADFSEIPEPTQERWTQFHEKVKEVEIAKSVENGETLENAQRIADDNFQARENIRRAELAPNENVPGNRRIINVRNRINDIARTESLTMTDAVTAYYHVRKHGKDSQGHFQDKHGWNIPDDQQETKYFTDEKNFIFKDGIRGFFSHQKNKFISQDGSHTSTVYRDGKGYFGVLKCPYDAHLGREVGKPTVATHFPKPEPAAAPPNAQARN